MHPLRSKPAAQVRHNFFYMLVGLLVLFVGVPLWQVLPQENARVVMYVVLAVALGISVWSLNGSRSAFLIGALFAVITIVLAATAVRWQRPALGYLILVSHLVFWSTGAWIAARALLAPGVVDLNRIVGSVCIYLMAGFIWTYLYLFQNLAVPGSFHGISGEPLYLQLPELAYFSFVTLTTLGYGDISPVTPFARALVNLEAIFGQFYIAILVAALVGIHISSRMASKRDPDNNGG